MCENKIWEPLTYVIFDIWHGDQDKCPRVIKNCICDAKNANFRITGDPLNLRLRVNLNQSIIWKARDQTEIVYFFLTLRVGNLIGMQRAFCHTHLEEEWTWVARPLQIWMTRPPLAIRNTWPRPFLKDRSTGSAGISQLCRSGSHRLTASWLLDQPLFRPKRFYSVVMPICMCQDTQTHTHTHKIL